MVNNTSLQIKAKDPTTDKTATTTITYINPSLTSQQLLTLTNKIAALQVGTVTSAIKISKEVVI